MYVLGVDAAKDNSTVALVGSVGNTILRKNIKHTVSDLDALSDEIKSYSPLRVVMESTGIYHLPVRNYFVSKGIPTAVVNPFLIKRTMETLRKTKTDKLDCVKIAKYGLFKWNELLLEGELDSTRTALKWVARAWYDRFHERHSCRSRLLIMASMNMPGIFGDIIPAKESSAGNYKWIDFFEAYKNISVIKAMSAEEFQESYRKWLTDYKYKNVKSQEVALYNTALNAIEGVELSSTMSRIIDTLIEEHRFLDRQVKELLEETVRLSLTTPEHGRLITITDMTDNLLAPIVAEIGNVDRFIDKKALVAYAGLDPKTYQSGELDVKSKISKAGSPYLRAFLFRTVDKMFKLRNDENVIYQHLRLKQSEGKPYISYMTSGCAKLLRIIYGTYHSSERSELPTEAFEPSN